MTKTLTSRDALATVIDPYCVDDMRYGWWWGNLCKVTLYRSLQSSASSGSLFMSPFLFLLFQKSQGQVNGSLA